MFSPTSPNWPQYEVDGTVLTYGNEEWLEVTASDRILNGVKFAGYDYSLSALSANTVSKEEVPLVPVSLTFPELPENVSIASVSTNGVAIEADGGVYTVADGAMVTVAFAAADGYVLFGSPASAVIAINGDTEFPSASLPTAIAPADAITINEIMASNPSVDKGGITNAHGIAEMDWVEFRNSASQDIDITGWYLSDHDEPFVIGNSTYAYQNGSPDDYGDRAWGGYADEVRLIIGAPSDAYLRAEYAGMADDDLLMYSPATQLSGVMILFY